MAEEVILVDAHDQELGLMEKMEAHRQGLLHRAFSVFVLNEKGELMVQQRAAEKYHSGGLWTNTCCSHPRAGESAEEAAHRRLQEEMGFDCPLQKVLEFTYRAELDKGMIEHEYDHLFIGSYNQEPSLNPEEAMAWKWMRIEDLSADIQDHPERYTAWFKIIWKQFEAYVISQA
ncbi:MAG: isopentenyl-diphosphate Delta-isomerase [Bacteroidetes bacterium]|nr:isopentenyl-diphosphate Delta-isomerase [Bacteroidota bacterium]